MQGLMVSRRCLFFPLGHMSLLVLIILLPTPSTLLSDSEGRGLMRVSHIELSHIKYMYIFFIFTSSSS